MRSPSSLFTEILIDMTKSPWAPEWASHQEVAGVDEVPVIHQEPPLKNICNMVSPSRYRQKSNFQTCLLHGYIADEALATYYRDPSKLLNKAQLFAATVTPDFSLLSEMPVHQRKRSVIQSRELGAYLQSHGITVVPNVRWAQLSDLDFVLAGIEQESTICISTQGLIRDRQLRQTLISGIRPVLEEIRPQQLIIYGSLPNDLLTLALDVPEVLNFPTDISEVMARAAS